jgi:hypothetical protein
MFCCTVRHGAPKPAIELQFLWDSEVTVLTKISQCTRKIEGGGALRIFIAERMSLFSRQTDKK